MTAGTDPAKASSRARRLAARLVRPLLAALVFGGAPPAIGAHDIEPLYQDPFDLGAGGASLTRASRDAIMIVNPALAPYGGAFHHWLGLQSTVTVNRESVELARSLAGGKSGSAGSGSSGAGDVVDELFRNPVHVGAGANLTWLTSIFGLTVLTQGDADVRLREYGDTGLPEARVEANLYGGAFAGAAFKTPFRWLSLGITGKYLGATEPVFTQELTGFDTKVFTDATSPDTIRRKVTPNRGIGADVGSLVFLQGKAVDLSFATKVDDVGGTQFAGEGESPTIFKQVVSAGLGLSLHTGADALHFAVDYRDVMNAYDVETFKRLHAGVKLLLRTYLGVGVGVYDGTPSYGAVLDLIFVRLSACAYTVEMGDHPGVDPRHLYQVGLAVGF